MISSGPFLAFDSQFAWWNFARKRNGCGIPERDNCIETVSFFAGGLCPLLVLVTFIE